MTTTEKHLTCQMEDDCTAPVTHIDNRGYIYCEDHGISRRSWCPCRKLLVRELKLLRAGHAIYWNSKDSAPKRSTPSTPAPEAKAKHTGGDWKHNRCQGAAPCAIWSEGIFIGTTDNDDHGFKVPPASEQAANCVLMAAAPSMLDALTQAIEESGYSVSGPTDHRAAEHGEPKWVCNARAAIAKATAG